MTEEKAAPSFRLVKYDDGRRELWITHSCAAWEGKPVEVRLPLHDVDGWQLVQEDPLIVRPSIHCLECGTHGYVTDGVWVDA